MPQASNALSSQTNCGCSCVFNWASEFPSTNAAEQHFCLGAMSPFVCKGEMKLQHRALLRFLPDKVAAVMSPSRMYACARELLQLYAVLHSKLPLGDVPSTLASWSCGSALFPECSYSAMRASAFCLRSLSLGIHPDRI